MPTAASTSQEARNEPRSKAMDRRGIAVIKFFEAAHLLVTPVVYFSRHKLHHVADSVVEGDEEAISESAKRGFALFTGKAICFACHSGWRFTDDKFHDIGTTTTDQGRGREVKDAALNFAFKTPTLRSVAVRAPYMHNASIANLSDVVRHYEKGGIDRPSHSPIMRPVQLSDQERADLVAFMETLTGTMDGVRAR